MYGCNKSALQKTENWQMESLRNVVVSIKEVWVLFLKFFMYLSNVSPGSP